MKEIKKAIIPIAGLGTRFLPLSKVMPKELWPLVDKPVIQYIVEEAKKADINQIIFVTSGEKKSILNYFKRSPKTEKFLKERKKDHLLQELKGLNELCQGTTFSIVFQKKPLGDGHAVLQAAKFIGEEPCAVLFADDVVYSKEPAILQLNKVFRTCEKPVLALYKIPREKSPLYGMVSVEKIANRFYKIKKIVEKPKAEETPSDLAIVGKYILTPEVFTYLKKAKPSGRGEIILAEVFERMIKEGKIIYGYELDGKWLECGNKFDWLQSNLYLSLKHPELRPKLKEFLKEENL